VLCGTVGWDGISHYIILSPFTPFALFHLSPPFLIFSPSVFSLSLSPNPLSSIFYLLSSTLYTGLPNPSRESKQKKENLGPDSEDPFHGISQVQDPSKESSVKAVIVTLEICKS
jgi:hypothetical protein